MGRAASRTLSDDVSWICNASTIARDTRSCTSKTSSIVPLYFSAQSGVSFSASTSCAAMRSALPALRTLPVSRYRTPSVRPISRGAFVVALNCMDELRDVTRSAFTPARSVMSSSVRPSEKNSLSASALMFVNGNTAMDFSSDAASGRDATARDPEIGAVRRIDTTCAPVAGRSAGAFSSSRPTSSAISAETSWRLSVTGGGE
ncbi:MAG: hypothetical protein ABIW79_10140 [Gemmatimonas sp.]